MNYNSSESTIYLEWITYYIFLCIHGRLATDYIALTHILVSSEIRSDEKIFNAAQKTRYLKISMMPNEFGVCMVYGRCCTEVRRARHTRVSRHFCICGADLESWVHCVVHIFYTFWPNWMEGNKGIPACLKYPPLPDLGLAGKPVPSELLYKLVPSTYIIEKIAFM